MPSLATAETSLPEGRHAFVVIQSDSGGHVSPPRSATLTLDVRTPAAPTITTPTAGGTYENTTGLVTGTAEPRARLHVRIDREYRGWRGVRPIGTGTIDVSREDPREVRKHGGHWLSVHQDDGARDGSETTGLRYVIRDTTAPNAPFLQSPRRGEVVTPGDGIPTAGRCR